MKGKYMEISEVTNSFGTGGGHVLGLEIKD
jgi:hypothetical protein